MAADDPMMRVRLPPELKARLVEASRGNNRSINAEIVHRLEKTFGDEERVAAYVSTANERAKGKPVSAQTQERLKALLEAYLADMRSDDLGDHQREQD